MLELSVHFQENWKCNLFLKGLSSAPSVCPQSRTIPFVWTILNQSRAQNLSRDSSFLTFLSNQSLLSLLLGWLIFIPILFCTLLLCFPFLASLYKLFHLIIIAVPLLCLLQRLFFPSVTNQLSHSLSLKHTRVCAEMKASQGEIYYKSGEVGQKLSTL